MQARRIDWKNHVVSLGVVFIGITAAFLLESWRQTRAERGLAGAYLLGFASDLGADARALDAAVETNQRKLERLDSIIAKLQDGPLERQQAVHVLGDMLSNHLFVPQESTYEAMRNSGQLNLIESLEQRRVVVSYYGLLNETAFKETVLNDYINAYVVPYVVDNFDMVRQSFRPGASHDEPRLQNLMVGYHLLLRQVLDSYTQIQQRNRDILVELQRTTSGPMDTDAATPGTSGTS